MLLRRIVMNLIRFSVGLDLLRVKEAARERHPAWSTALGLWARKAFVTVCSRRLVEIDLYARTALQNIEASAELRRYRQFARS